jgi:repressor LexA
MAQHTKITPAQQETFSYLKQYIAKNGESPTILAMSKEFGLRSLRSVTQRLEALERKGLIARDRFQHRGIEVLHGNSSGISSGTIQVPVIASAGCDAMEVYAQDEFGEYILVDKNLINVHTNIAAIKAVGDSMQDAGIRNGDYVIVEVTDQVDTGDRVVAIIGNMAVIKQFERSEGVVYLHPENKSGEYHSIVVGQEDSKVFGKVLSVIPGTEWVDDIKIEYYPGYTPSK